MPWTIWPSLVVLWGVCWMFKGSSRIGDSVHESPRSVQQEEQAFNGNDTEDWLFDFPVIDDNGGPPMFDWNNLQWIPLGTVNSSPNLSLDPSQFFQSEVPLPADSYTLTEHSDRVEATACTSVEGPYTGQCPDAAGSSIPLILNIAGESDFLSGTRSADEAANNDNATSQSPASRGQVDTRVSCPKCPKAFSRRDALIRHLREICTGGAEEHLCPHQLCKRSQKGHGFLRKDRLQRHLQTCKARKRKTYQASTMASHDFETAISRTTELRQGGDVNQSDTDDAKSPDDEKPQHILELERTCEAVKERILVSKREIEKEEQLLATLETALQNWEKARLQG